MQLETGTFAAATFPADEGALRRVTLPDLTDHGCRDVTRASGSVSRPVRFFANRDATPPVGGDATRRGGRTIGFAVPARLRHTRPLGLGHSAVASGRRYPAFHSLRHRLAASAGSSRPSFFFAVPVRVSRRRASTPGRGFQRCRRRAPRDAGGPGPGAACLESRGRWSPAAGSALGRVAGGWRVAVTAPVALRSPPGSSSAPRQRPLLSMLAPHHARSPPAWREHGRPHERGVPGWTDHRVHLRRTGCPARAIRLRTS